MEGDWRYERKFLVTALPACQVAGVLRRHPARFVPAFPPRWVNNLYFDTFDGRCLTEAVVGISERAKYRVRWYGELFGSIEASRYEIKDKRGLLGAKRSFPVPPWSLRRGEPLLAPERLLAGAELPDIEGSRLRALEARLLNRYLRRYMVSHDGSLRLTLETDLSFLAVHRGRNPFLRSARDATTTIVELKYPPGADDVARWAASRLPFRMTRSSKYVRGLELVGRPS